MLRVIPLVLAATIAALFVACGGDDSSTASQTNDEAGLTAALKARAAAAISQDPQAIYKEYAKACRDETSYGQFAPSVTVGSAIFESFYKVKLGDLNLKDVFVRNVANGKGEGRVSYVSKKDAALVIDDKNKFDPYVYESGGWYDANCAGLKFGAQSSPTAAK